MLTCNYLQSEDRDQAPRSAASDLSLHYFPLRPLGAMNTHVKVRTLESVKGECVIWSHQFLGRLQVKRFTDILRIYVFLMRKLQ